MADKLIEKHDIQNAYNNLHLNRQSHAQKRLRQRSEHDLKNAFKEQASEISQVEDMRNHALREYNERVLIRSLDARYKQSVSRMEARVQALEAAGDIESYQTALHDL